MYLSKGNELKRMELNEIYLRKGNKWKRNEQNGIK